MTLRRADACCSILSHAAVVVRLSEIGPLRDAPSLAGSPSLPKRFLRYCDEQTVVGMAAVLQAIDRFPEPRPSFTAWGVLSASCQAGRIMGGAAVIATRTQGPQGITPHVVPQCSLHSAASAVSVGLSMHGPHFGIGGGAEAFDEGILSACALLSGMHDRNGKSDRSAGVWLVFTAWDHEPTLDPSGRPVTDPTLFGLAIAAQPGRVASAGHAASARAEASVECVMRVGPSGGATPSPATASATARGMFHRLREFAAGIDRGGAGIASIQLRHGFSLHVEPVRPATGIRTLEAA